MTKYGNGLFYLGTEAKDIGLIDILGGKDEAIAQVKKLAGITEYELVFYQKKPAFLDILRKISTEFGFNIGRGFGETLIKQEDFDIKLE